MAIGDMTFDALKNISLMLLNRYDSGIFLHIPLYAENGRWKLEDIKDTHLSLHMLMVYNQSSEQASFINKMEYNNIMVLISSIYGIRYMAFQVAYHGMN